MERVKQLARQETACEPAPELHEQFELCVGRSGGVAVDHRTSSSSARRSMIRRGSWAVVSRSRVGAVKAGMLELAEPLGKLASSLLP